MKHKIKLFGIIALAALIGFSIIGCDNGTGGGGTPTYSLDGIWENSVGAQFTINGTTAVRNSFGTLNAFWQDAANKGYIAIGQQTMRNITSNSNGTWSCQLHHVTYNTSRPNVATGDGWGNATITLSNNGQTLTAGSDVVWTRKQ